MQLIRGLHNLRPQNHGCVATIGNFDGLHRGHQQIFQQLRQQGEVLGLPVVVIFFEPQPAEFFAPQRAEPRITRLRDKLQLLSEQPVDFACCLRFNQQLAQMPAQEFVSRVLVAGVGVRHLVVGPDFRFGARRCGDYELLSRSGEEHGFTVVAVEPFDVAGERVSSTRVRIALQKGAFAEVTEMLGRPYSLGGVVRQGDRIGRTIGFPTVNLALSSRADCLNGVYAVKLSGGGLVSHPGVANIGTRPTVEGSRRVLEVHLLDYQGDLYGERVRVEFVHWLRAEQKFSSLEKLKEQIRRDGQTARNFFSNADQD